MWARLKAMPLAVKIVLGCFLVLFVYGATHQPPADHDTAVENNAGADNPLLHEYEEEYARVMASLNQCAAEMQQRTNQMQGAVMNGQMPVNAQPECMQFYPQWLARAAFLEAQISRLRTGDTRSLREITGIQAGSAADGGSHDSASRGGGDSGEDAVDRWDRGAIRGTSMYTDENGVAHELPTARYYYHDLQTGQFVPSQSPTPPNGGHDYTPMTSTDVGGGPSR